MVYIDYWVGVWWVEPTIRYRIQTVSCASVKITLNKLVHRLTNIQRFSNMNRIWRLEQH